MHKEKKMSAYFHELYPSNKVALFVLFPGEILRAFLLWAAAVLIGQPAWRMGDQTD